MNTNVDCLFISPDTALVGSIIRQVSVMDIANFLAVDNKITDLSMTYAGMIKPADIHDMLMNAVFTEKSVKMKGFELDKESIINVPIKMLFSPIQVAASIQYYNSKNDPYVLNMGPVIKTFDAITYPPACGWEIAEHSADI